MTEETISLAAPGGTVDGYAYAPAGKGPWPGVLFFMDGLGLRPALREMGRRLADQGYYVLLPNLYYRAGPAETVDLIKDRERAMKLVGGIDQDSMARDGGVFLSFLSENKNVTGARIGCTGYCLGGRCTLLAAGGFPERIAAAASFHGAGLATDAPQSAHRRAHAMRAEIYVGVAEIDPYLAPGETDRLKGALEGAALSHKIELYPGAEHGFAVPGNPPYNKDASERHWDALLGLFKKTL